MTKRRTYSGTFKAQIVLELLRGKKSLLELAALYQVHPNQIKNWKSVFLHQAPELFADKRKKRVDGQASKRNLSD